MLKPISSFLLAFFCILGQAVHAEQPEKPLLLASVDNIPPFVFKENGKLTGISIDIVNELARRGGFEITIETYPWARVLRQLENGQVDGAFSLYEKEERKRYCLYTGLIHYDELCIATKEEKQFQYTGIESLYGKVVGKGRSVFVSDEFDTAVREGNITLLEIDDMNMSNIKMLHADRLDAVIGSPQALLYYTKVLGYDDIVLLPTPLKEKIPAYFVLSKHSALENKEEWQRKITSLLNEMHADGTIQTINARYGVDSR